MARRSRFSGDDSPPPKLDRASWKKAASLLAYLWREKAVLAVATLALSGSSALGLAFPWLAGQLVDAASTGPDGAANLLLGGDLDKIAAATVFMLMCQGAFAFAQSIGFATAAERALVRLRKDTYARVVRLPMGFFAQRRVGELASRLGTDLSQIEDTLIMSVPQFLRQFFSLVGGLVMLLVTSVRLAGVMLATLPAVVLVAVVFGRRIQAFSRTTQDRLADTATVVEETLQGMATVKAFANELHEEKRYGTGLDAFLVAALKGARWRAGFVSFVFSALFGAVVLVTWYGTTLVKAQVMSIGDLTRFILYTTFVTASMASLSEVWSQIQRMVGATARVRELLEEPVEAIPHERLPLPASSILHGEVALENVHFSYPSRPEVEVLKGVSLRAKKGQRIALVGPSGAGKSTVAALLLRFYEPSRGQLLLDGRPASEIPLEHLRRQVAVVPQDVLLFGGSIEENIAYGRPGASLQDIQRAAAMANADSFINALPEKYATLVGERGVKLSGGQRQRVAIARAILRDPAILVLDEATSALDSTSEQAVQQALETLMEGRTSFIIAHRLSTIRSADVIAVVNHGEVVEMGSHEQLVQVEGGLYRSLSQAQQLGQQEQPVEH